MRKLLLTALVTTVGCATGSEAPRPEAVTRTAQEIAAAGSPSRPGVNADENPSRAQILPAPGSSGGGGAGDGGGVSPPPSIWKPLNNPAPIGAGIALLLTDGSVMVEDLWYTNNWWKLTPDPTGSYLNGTWSELAAMPGDYWPLYFGSAVLPDGRVIIEGGEYETDGGWSTKGAIYDPTKDQWTAIAPPGGWTTIGDAASIVLADGRYMLSNCCTKDQAILDSSKLTWTAIGTGQADINNEQGWTLLPNGDVLTIDTNDFTDLLHSEIFSPRTGVWSSGGDTVVKLDDTFADGTGSWEMGPQMLRPDGTVLAVGATGHNAVYNTRSGRWTAAPDFPVIPNMGPLASTDGPAALLPDGRVLVAVSPNVGDANGTFANGLHMFEFDGNDLREIQAPPNAAALTSYQMDFLLLPTGEVLATNQTNDVQIYSPNAQPSCGSAPHIDASCGFGVLQPGSTYRLSGTQLHGLSEAVAYGDDAQAATNYPLVRITNHATGHVSYARTHDHSTMSVAPGVESFTFFDVPATQEAGPSDLAVVANGIASDPIEVRIEPAR